MYVFEHNARFAFCQVFRTSVTYKSRQNDFDTIFSWTFIMLVYLSVFSKNLNNK